MSFQDYVDERMLISHDVLGKKEMKIKVIELSDENAPSQWKLGDRVKINKILVTIKHMENQEIEEGEFENGNRKGSWIINEDLRETNNEQNVDDDWD